MKNPYEIMLASLQAVPEEYFRMRNSMDESIYLYFDQIKFIIDKKGKIFKDKKTNKRNAFELNHSLICETKVETLANLLTLISRK